MKNNNRFSASFLVGFIICLGFNSCSVSGEKGPITQDVKEPRAANECPQGNHTDSIIPIVYGFPTEEDFRKSDSGLVALGGCELPEKLMNFYCKIHRIQF